MTVGSHNVKKYLVTLLVWFGSIANSSAFADESTTFVFDETSSSAPVKICLHAAVEGFELGTKELEHGIIHRHYYFESRDPSFKSYFDPEDKGYELQSYIVTLIIASRNNNSVPTLQCAVAKKIK